MEQYLTSSQFATAIGKSVSTVRRWHNSNQLKADFITPTGRRLYSPYQVEMYQKEEKKYED